jgi:hypothetical protein
MIIRPCVWMRADKDGEIWCERPHLALKNSQPCDTDLIHPDVCDYYKPDLNIIIANFED